MTMQLGLTESVYVRKEKVTLQQRFLQEVPWAELERCVSPYYDKTGVKDGCPPVRLGIMLRIHFLQQWFSLSDPGTEEKLNEVGSMCAFAGVDRSLMDVSDQTTILSFRHPLEKHGLAQELLDCVNEMLTARGLLLKRGALVDATLIDASSSTRSKEVRRDPEMHSIKKGGQWHFGMMAHTGVDVQSGLVRTVVGTAANAHDVTQAEHQPYRMRLPRAVATPGHGARPEESRPNVCTDDNGVQPHSRAPWDKSVHRVHSRLKRAKNLPRSRINEPKPAINPANISKNQKPPLSEM